MDIYFVNRNRLNVYITDRELAERHIDLHTLFSDGAEFQTALKKMLAEIDDTENFPLKNTALEIELFPVAEGDLLVSLYRGEERELQAVFSDSEDIIACCTLLHPFHGQSSLYFYRDKYYLCLKTDQKGEVDCLLREFADRIMTIPIDRSILSEYGKVICVENCVNLFTKYFKN